MNHENTNESNDAKNAVSQRSQVTPNTALKRKKEQWIFLGIVFLCLVVAVLMIMPEKEGVRAENENQSDATVHDTLTQNLALLTRLKEEASKALHTPNGITPDRQLNHPPIARETKNTTAKISQETLARMNASNTFTLESSQLNGENSQSSTNARPNGFTETNANSQFMNQQDEIVEVKAKRLPHPDYTIPAGELIPATLEVAINSDLPGMVRAITTRDIYSLSSGNRLIPSGSTLVGQYNSSIVQGQSRLLVVWNRVERSDGVIVTLNSPGTDAIGRAGMGADVVERHFMKRFGTSALLSILGGYSALSGVGNQDQYNSKSQYRMGIANSLQQTAGQTLEDTSGIKPTLSINQGARINVFVAHDLDFNSVGATQDVTLPQVHHVKGGLWKQ